MSKNTIKDIATELVDKHSLSPVQADKFVDELFKLVSEVLPSDKIVKIKGLGTFKIIEVQDRESVNVNTGERVIIEGHGKVSFTPDNSMKDLVNKPFSQFETVIVNDNVDFAEIDNKDEDAAILADLNNDDDSLENEYTPDSESNNLKKEIQKEETKLDLESESVKDQSDCNVVCSNEIIENEPDNEQLHEQVQNNQQLIQPESCLKDDCGLSSSSNQDTAEPKEKVEQKPVNVSESSVDPNSEKEQLKDNYLENDPPKEVLIDSELVDEEEHKSHLFLKIVCSILFGLIIFGGGFYIGQYFSANGIYNLVGSESMSGKTEKTISKKSKNFIPKAHVRLLAQKKSSLNVKPKVNTVAGKTAADNDVKKKSELDKVNDDESQSLVYDNKNAQVRTGAYRIIGVDKVITLKSDESVKKISDRILGPGMECYISVINDVNVTKTLNKGQKIKIPKLELRHHKVH